MFEGPLRMPCAEVSSSEMDMQQTDDKAKSNVRLALILGAVALGFFVMGIYLSIGKEG